MWRLYAEYGRQNGRFAVVGVLGTLFSRLLGLVPAYVLGLAVDAVFFQRRSYRLPLVPVEWLPTASNEQLWISVAVVVAATLLSAAISWSENWGWNAFAQRVQHALRVDTYATMQGLDMAFFDERQTGELMSILSNDVNQLETFLNDGMSSALRILVMVLGIGAIMVALDPALALVALVPVPILAVFTALFVRAIQPKYAKMRASVGALNARLENNLGGIEVIKTEHSEGFETGRVTDSSKGYFDANWAAIRTRITFFPGLGVISGLGFALTFAVGGFWVLSGSLTPGAFVTFMIYTQQFVWPMAQFGQIINMYQRAKASSARVFGLIEESGRLDESATAPDLAVPAGAVEYDRVSFAYDTEHVIKDVTFGAAPGETIGVVGPTGGGKSTLLKLLVRLYDVDSGAIEIDGTDVREVTLESLRRAVGYVSQEPFLFYGTVRENIAYGTFEASDDEIEAAARAAAAHDFIENLPDGYETMVGERGIKLSGGQRQRVALARTILKDPAIVVLDEATSHVDTETEALIQRSLARVATGKTAFVIAHRLSTVKNADEILVLDDGQVREQGTHDELLAQDGLYANLWRVQAGEIEDLPREFIERAIRRGAVVEEERDVAQ